MITGCYVMHLYCNDPSHTEDVFTDDSLLEVIGNNRSECIREARRQGWLVRDTKDPSESKVLCPQHRGRK